MITYAFLGIITLVVSGIYASFCYVGFDPKQLYEEYLNRKQEGAESTQPTYFSGLMSGLSNLVIIFIVVMASITLIKMNMVRGMPKLGEFTDIVVASLISVFLVVGLTMAAVRMLPIMGRAFENTIGYFVIDKFGGLEDNAQALFTNNSGSNIKYGVIATKMFDSGFFEFLEKMTNAETSPINGIYLKKDVLEFDGKLNTTPEDGNPVYQFFKKVALKHSISEATWISLATVVSLFSGFIMIQYSGIRKKL
jgi:hypothetical protein